MLIIYGCRGGSSAETSSFEEGDTNFVVTSKSDFSIKENQVEVFSD